MATTSSWFASVISRSSIDSRRLSCFVEVLGWSRRRELSLMGFDSQPAAPNL